MSPLVATKDTYGYEQASEDVEVRRLIKAGQPIPPTVTRFEDDSAVEDVPGPPMVGLGAAAPYYKHQLDERGQVREEHAGRGGAVTAGQLSEEDAQEDNKRQRNPVAAAEHSRKSSRRSGRSGDDE